MEISNKWMVFVGGMGKSDYLCIKLTIETNENYKDFYDDWNRISRDDASFVL